MSSEQQLDAMTSSVGQLPLSEPVNDASQDMLDIQRNLKRRHDELGHDPEDPESQRERKMHVAENLTNGMPVSPTRKGLQDVNDPSKADSTQNHVQNDDVAMVDGTTDTSENADDAQQNAASSTQMDSSSSPSRKTCPTKPIVDGVAMVAAVAVAEAEAAAQKEAALSNGAQPSANGTASTAAPHTTTDTTATSSVASKPANDNSEPLPAASLNFENAPSTESIIRVAEAVVAAQEAAKAAKDKSKESSTHDPNLDPSLFSPANNTTTTSTSVAKTNGTTQPVAKPPAVNTAVASSSSSTQVSASCSGSATPSTSSATTPSSTLSNNPYMSLAKMGALTPTHLMMPYPLFYPHPGTPVTPNTPSYPMPYNPYYYLASPLMASPGGVYPPIPPTTAAAASSSSSSASASTSQPRPAAAPAAAEQPSKPKAKRTKTHAVTSKSFSIPVVPRDKNRKPMLPLNVGIMTVINLGVVCMREHFHSERYIFPVGYEVTRRYLSTVDPAAEVVYHCTILDGGDGPKFQIVPSDRPDKPVIAGTATGAWSSIVKQANHIRNRQHSNSVSGPDFFGLGQNTIKHLIQELPNADRLRDYVWQNFMEGGPLGGRHAAVIPALPEEYDSSLPLGAYYPKRDPSNPNVPRGMAHYPSHIIAQAEAERGHKYIAGSTPQHSVGSRSGSPTPQPQSMQMQIQMQVQPTPPESLQHQNGGQPPLQIIPQNPGGPPTLNIQEYHPPQQQQPQQQIQEPISAPSGPLRQYTPEKRTKAVNGTNTNGSISAPVPPPAVTTPGRATRSSTRGAQKQTQQAVTQQQQAQAQLQAHLLQQQQQHGMQEGMPTTLAGVMQMYPTLSGVNMPSGTNS